MITLKELNPKNYPVTPEIEENLQKLHKAMNIIRSAYGKPMIVTSGLRDVEHHKNIYRKKGISEDKIPMGSKHLVGAACDIYDPTGELHQWCRDNPEILEQAGVWLETRQGNWQHFQIEPPKSGNRWFNP